MFEDAEDDKGEVVDFPIKASNIIKAHNDVKETLEDLEIDDEDDFEDSDLDDDDDFDDFFEDDRGKIVRGQQAQQAKNVQPRTKSAMQPSEKVALDKFSHKINLDDRKSGYRVKDKSDRATIEQVMDPRTRMILFKLLNRRFIDSIDGCVSTGKEANVYHCTSEQGQSLACKIFKTSILVFKDRDKYVTGEFRFRHGYGRKNPRKMVRTWAEKEMRNLTRLHNAGISCPTPILLRSHVLLMSFVGENSWPAPRLSDVEISESKARQLYFDLALDIRKIYHVCKLVHGDLSEYNLLYDNGRAVIIDVSQSVEHDHPNALGFLRKDITNVSNFFRKKGVSNVLTVQELFDFVVRPNFDDDDSTAGKGVFNSEKAELELERLSKIAGERGDVKTAEEEIDEAVFKQIFIPRRLGEVDKAQRDIDNIKSGKVTDVPYKAVTGLQIHPEDDEEGTDDDEESELASLDESESGGFKDSRRPRDESPSSKKDRKKAVKAEQAEKRKTKVKKHIKKRKTKKS